MKNRILLALLLSVGMTGRARPALAQTTIPVVTSRGAYNAGTTYGLGAMVTYQGATYLSLVSPNTGNTPATSPSSWARQAALSVITIGSSGSSQTIDVGNGDKVVDLTLSAACSITFTNATGVPGRLTLIIRPAGFTATLPSSSGAIAWSGGTPPSVSLSSSTVISFVYSGVAPILGGL